MRTVIFRDDDTSYFTPPERLEAIYGRVWAAGRPVCLAVVPWVYADTRVYWSEGNPHDPGIPPAYRGAARNFGVGDNRALCDFLNDKAAAGLVEICLHGYTHTFFEFITHDRPLIRRKLEQGRELLGRAFPAADIKTFVPPYDRISPAALEELVAAGFHISTMSHNLGPLPALPQMAGFAAGRISPRQMLYICDDYLFTYQRDPAESLRRARESLAADGLTIVSNHYWMFYHPWRARPNSPDYRAWNALLDEVLVDARLKFTGFSRYAERHGGET